MNKRGIIVVSAVCILCALPGLAQQYTAKVTEVGKNPLNLPGFFGWASVYADKKGNFWLKESQRIVHVSAEKGYIAAYKVQYLDVFYSPQNDEVFSIGQKGSTCTIYRLDQKKGPVAFDQFTGLPSDIKSAQGAVSGDMLYLYAPPNLYSKAQGKSTVNSAKVDINEALDLQCLGNSLYLLQPANKLAILDVKDGAIRAAVDLPKMTRTPTRIQILGGQLYTLANRDYTKFEIQPDGTLKTLITEYANFHGYESDEMFPSEKGFYYSTFQNGIAGVFHYVLQEKTSGTIYHPERKDDTVLYSPQSMAPFKDQIYVLDHPDIKVFRGASLVRKMDVLEKESGLMTVDKNGTLYYIEYYKPYLFMIKDKETTQVEGKGFAFFGPHTGDSGSIYLESFNQGHTEEFLVEFDPEKKEFRKLLDIERIKGSHLNDYCVVAGEIILAYSPNILRKYTKEGKLIQEGVCSGIDHITALAYSPVLKSMCTVDKEKLFLVDPVTFGIKAQIPAPGVSYPWMIAVDDSGAIYTLNETVKKITLKKK